MYGENRNVYWWDLQIKKQNKTNHESTGLWDRSGSLTAHVHHSEHSPMDPLSHTIPFPILAFLYWPNSLWRHWCFSAEFILSIFSSYLLFFPTLFVQNPDYCHPVPDISGYFTIQGSEQYCTVILYNPWKYLSWLERKGGSHLVPRLAGGQGLWIIWCYSQCMCEKLRLGDFGARLQNESICFNWPKFWALCLPLLASLVGPQKASDQGLCLCPFHVPHVVGLA